MKARKGYLNQKSRTSTGKWLKYYFAKRTCRRKEKKEAEKEK